MDKKEVADSIDDLQFEPETRELTTTPGRPGFKPSGCHGQALSGQVTIRSMSPPTLRSPILTFVGKKLSTGADGKIGGCQQHCSFLICPSESEPRSVDRAVIARLLSEPLQVIKVDVLGTWIFSPAGPAVTVNLTMRSAAGIRIIKMKKIDLTRSSAGSRSSSRRNSTRRCVGL